MKAYLIDAYERQIREVELPSPTGHAQLAEMYRLLKCEHLGIFLLKANEGLGPGSTADIFYFDGDDPMSHPVGFTIEGSQIDHIYGNALVVGTRGEDSAPPKANLDDVKRQVTGWLGAGCSWFPA